MKINDLYIIAAVVALAAALWLGQRFFLSAEGNRILVTENGEMEGTYSLSEDRVLEFTDKNGGKNVLTIKEGKAWMSDADCPDKLCMKQNTITKTGESIICLPHKLVIEVQGDEAAELDAIVQ